MNFLAYWFQNINVVWYISHTGPKLPAMGSLPQFPQAITLERISLLILFLILTKPLLKIQKDPKLENERLRTLKFAALFGILTLGFRFYRILAGV